MKLKIKQELLKRGLNEAQYQRALEFCNERFTDGYSLKEIHQVLKQKQHMHPLTVLGKSWFPKLVKEIT